MKIKRAMLFAAGLGERLIPLTGKRPKPMLPLGEKPIIDYSLSYLKCYGIEEVVINLHYLGDVIKNHLKDGSKFGLKIHYSTEEELLGTGGGLKKAQGYFKDEKAFVVMNSDTLIDCDLNELTSFHEREGMAATLVVIPWMAGHTKVQIANNRFLNVGDGDYLYSGLMIATPSIFTTLSEEESNLVLDGILPLMNTVKGIAAFTHTGYWRDIGTLKSYEEAQGEWAANHHNRLS